MKHSAVIAAAAGLASASLTVRQTGAAGPQDSTGVCSGPNMACSDVENIQTDCDAQFKTDKNGHGSCMCKDGGKFFQKWAECRRCLADNNLIPQNELAGWLGCNSKAQADICSGNPLDLYSKVFAGLEGSCASGQSQDQASGGAPSASAGTGAPGASGAPGFGASQTTAVTTATSSASTATASGADSSASVATGVAPSTGSSPSQGSSGSGAGSSNPASTPASTTSSRNSTSSSSRQGSSNTLVNAAASPKAAFASVLAVAAAGAGFFLAL